MESAATTSAGSATCALSAGQEEGPFYVALGMVRSDVRESTPGVQLTLRLTVKDRSTCQPLANAAVDIWSASGLGAYSAEAEENTAGQTYLRGVQMTDAHGNVTFTTLYPGWYSGRTNYVHVKVHVAGSVSGNTYSDGSAGHVVYTGQLFFPQTENDAVKRVAPYTANTDDYVTNAQDQVYTRQSGKAVELTLVGTPTSQYVGSITLIVDHTAGSP